MFRRLFVFSPLLLAASFCSVPLAEAVAPAKLTATEVIEKNVVARGGLAKWRLVQSLRMSGTMEAGGNSRTSVPTPFRKDHSAMPAPRPIEQVRLPFVMELKRPLKMRVEVEFRGQSAIQVYDGSHGWKLRPFLNRREVEPYTEEEMKAVATQAGLDGPLVDYVAKGTTVALIGDEKVEGHDTYRLRLTLRSGKTQDVWIDAGTFLEAKMEGTPRRLDGQERPVEVYYRDFRTVDGLEIPFLLETQLVNPRGGLGGRPLATSSEQIHLDEVQVNAPLEDSLFSKAALDAAVNGSPATVAVR